MNAPVSKTGKGGFVLRGFESPPLRWTARLGRFLLGVGASGAGAVGQPGPTRDWPTSGSSFPSRSPGGGRDQGRHRPVHPPSAHRCNRATRANVGQRGPARLTFRSLEHAWAASASPVCESPTPQFSLSSVASMSSSSCAASETPGEAATSCGRLSAGRTGRRLSRSDKSPAPDLLRRFRIRVRAGPGSRSPQALQMAIWRVACRLRPVDLVLSWCGTSLRRGGAVRRRARSECSVWPVMAPGGRVLLSHGGAEAGLGEVSGRRCVSLSRVAVRSVASSRVGGAVFCRCPACE